MSVHPTTEGRNIHAFKALWVREEHPENGNHAVENKPGFLFKSLIKIAEQVAGNANSYSKLELVSVIQDVYSSLMRLSIHLTNGYLDKIGLSSDSEVIQSLRQVVTLNPVADLLEAGWYLESSSREYTLKNGETRIHTYYRLRKWIVDDLGKKKHICKYIGKL